MAFGIADYVWDYTDDTFVLQLMLEARDNPVLEPEHTGVIKDQFLRERPSEGVSKSIEAYFVSLETAVFLAIIGGSTVKGKYIREPPCVLGVVEDYSVKAYPRRGYKVTYTITAEPDPEQIRAVCEVIKEKKRSLLYAPPIQELETVVLGKTWFDD